MWGWRRTCRAHVLSFVALSLVVLRVSVPFIRDDVIVLSTNGEGSRIFQGASRLWHRCLQNGEINILLLLFDFEGGGSLHLNGIYQFSTSKRCVVDFRHVEVFYLYNLASVFRS